MRLSLKAKVTVAAGMLAAMTFLILGIRDLQRPARAETGLSKIVRAASKQAPALAVLAVAARPIETGETITADMIRNADGDPARFPTIATAAEVIGKVATQALPAGARIPRAAVDLTAKLAIRVPVNMRAMSIDTTAEIAVAGLVRPGDRVDVQVVYPGADAISGARGEGISRARTLLQMVQVLAVGDLIVGAQEKSGIGGTASPPPPARTVTLALTPDQVSVLSLAKATGSLYLSLRNPADSTEVAVATVHSDGAATPASKAAPAPVAIASQSQPGDRSPRHAIDLVVGSAHQVIYSEGH